MQSELETKVAFALLRPSALSILAIAKNLDESIEDIAEAIQSIARDGRYGVASRHASFIGA
jgi:hypothetical protein